MEKIRLNNGVEFDLIPMGIDNRENVREFIIESDLGQDKILTELRNPENLKLVEYICEDGIVGITFLDCVSFKSLKYAPIMDGEIEINRYIVEINVNELERKLIDVQGELEELKRENVTLKELVDTLLITALEVQ